MKKYIFHLFIALFTCIVPKYANAQIEQIKSPNLQQDTVGNRMRAFAVPENYSKIKASELAPDSYCIDEGTICLAAEEKDDGRISFIVQDKSWPTSDPRSRRSIALSGEIPANASVKLWNQYVQKSGGDDSVLPNYIIGIVVSSNETYSGGGASFSKLYLYEVLELDIEYTSVREILSIPLSAEKTIRACFSEKDQKMRRGACHDRYAYDARIDLSPHFDGLSDANGYWPILEYTAVASAYPRTSRIGEDNLGRKLTEADLVERRDEACSFARKLKYDPLIRRYNFDTPGPDCSDYIMGSE